MFVYLVRKLNPSELITPLLDPITIITLAAFLFGLIFKK